VLEKTIPELQQAMAASAITSRELVALYLQRIAAYDQKGPSLNTMLALNPRALATAEALDRERKEKGPRGPLHGIPVVVKDNFETEDMATTGGSMALAGFQTRRDAFQVQKLRAAGAVIIGKTNLHELAHGFTTVSSLGGQTRNPYDLTRNPGGSSGGSAAAVAANFAVAGMGSDTCGSIRLPAAHNNLVGLRGTPGLSSRAGVIPLSHTQDMGGPVARTVTDLALMLDATVGPDPADKTTVASTGRMPPSYRDGLRDDALRSARIGVLRDLFGTAPEDAEVTAIINLALDRMKAQGAEIVEVTLPGLEGILQGSALFNEFKADLTAYLAQFPDAPVHSLDEILARGEFHASLGAVFRQRNAVIPDGPWVARAMEKRAAARALILKAFAEHQLDALAYPIVRRRAAVVEERQWGVNCQLSPCTSLPAINIPAGFTDDGLPVGVDLLGVDWSESRLLALAYAYEQAAKPRRPPVTVPALVRGMPPPPVSFTIGLTGAEAADSACQMAVIYEPGSGRLAYELITPDKDDELLAAAIHRGPNPGGPVMLPLVHPLATARTGELMLAPYQRTLLMEGSLFVTLRTKKNPQRVLRGELNIPRLQNADGRDNRPE